MPRIRTLKPECWQDEALGGVSRDARLLFIGLITQADDEGRLRGAAALVKAQIFPYDAMPPKDCEKWLQELSGRGLIQRYEVKHEQFIALKGWRQNQRISHPTPTVLPSPPEDSGELRVGKNRKGRDQGKDHVASSAPNLPADSEAPFIREVVARFNEAATNRNITVNARLIERAIRDHSHASVQDLKQVCFACVDWLAKNAPRNGAKPRVAHLTLRTFLRDLPKEAPSERRYTRPLNA